MRLPATTNGRPSGLKKAPKPLANLLVREKFAAVQSGLAPFNGLNETVLFFEVTRNHVLHNFVRIAALLDRPLCEPRLQVGAEMDFHGFKIRETPATI